MANSSISSSAPISTLLSAQTISPVGSTTFKPTLRPVIDDASNARSGLPQGTKPVGPIKGDLPRGSLLDILA